MWQMNFNEKTENYDVSWASNGDPRPQGDRYSETESHSSARAARRSVFMREAQELGVNLRSTPRARANDEARPGVGAVGQVGLGFDEYY